MIISEMKRKLTDEETKVIRMSVQELQKEPSLKVHSVYVRENNKDTTKIFSIKYIFELRGNKLWKSK